jgi:hypothetical protein
MKSSWIWAYSGAVILTATGFMLHPVVGMFFAGSFCVAFAIIKAGAGE